MCVVLIPPFSTIGKHEVILKLNCVRCVAFTVHYVKKIITGSEVLSDRGEDSYKICHSYTRGLYTGFLTLV